MIGYLGSPGALVALPYRGGLDVVSDRPVSFVRTLSGKRKSLLGARARREWSVSVDLAGSRDFAGLIDVARSGGECVWYPADAVAGNMFSPQASGFEIVPAGAMDAGLVQLPDGTVARTIAAATRVRIGDAHGDHEGVPVGGASTVTVGAWGASGFRFSGWWRDALGDTVTNILTNPGSWSGWQWREQTFTVPAGAVFLDLQLIEGTQYARPSVAWGDTAKDRPGRGCTQAIAHGLSEALTVIGSDDSYGSVGLTITEVG